MIDEARAPLPTMLQLYRNDIDHYPDSHLDLPLRCAVRICTGLPKFWPYVMDFIQEGNLELLRCIEVWNERGIEDNERFRTYAAACIKGAIYHYFCAIPAIMIPSGSRSWIKRKGIEEEERLRVLERCVSLEALFEHMITIPEPTNMQQAFSEAASSQVQGLLSRCSETERTVITMYYGLENGTQYTSEEIAKQFDVNVHHIHHLKRQGIKRARGEEAMQPFRKRGKEERGARASKRLQHAYDQAQGNITVCALVAQARCHTRTAAAFLRARKST